MEGSHIARAYLGLLTGNFNLNIVKGLLDVVMQHWDVIIKNKNIRYIMLVFICWMKYQVLAFWVWICTLYFHTPHIIFIIWKDLTIANEDSKQEWIDYYPLMLPNSLCMGCGMGSSPPSV